MMHDTVIASSNTLEEWVEEVERCFPEAVCGAIYEADRPPSAVGGDLSDVARLQAGQILTGVLFSESMRKGGVGVSKASRAIGDPPGAVDRELLDDVVRRIVEAANPGKIILFGSAARGQMGPNSDLDLLVIAETSDRYETAGDIYVKLHGVGMAVDVLVATPEEVERHKDTKGLVYKRALEEGCPVYDAAASDPHRPRQNRRTRQSCGAIDESLLAEVVRRVVEASAAQKVILFGPAARGQMGPDRDIPLLIVAESDNTRKTAARIYERLYGVGIGVTAVVTTPEHMKLHSGTPGLVFRHALEDGKVLYEAT